MPARLDWRRRHELSTWAIDHIYTPNVEQPEDWPDVYRRGPRGLSPLYCGDHATGLTGVYALVNGFKLLLAEAAPLRPSDETMLLELGWNFMRGRGMVAPHVGMRQHSFIRMAEAMSFALSRRRGDWVRCEVPRMDAAYRIQAAATLERLLVAKRVVLILLGRGHYTVLRGYTPAGWLIFDAMGRQWMLRRGAARVTTFMLILILSRSS